MEPSVYWVASNLFRMFQDSQRKPSTRRAAAAKSPPDCDSNPSPPIVSDNSCAASCWAGRHFRDSTVVMGITPCNFSQSASLPASYCEHHVTMKWVWDSVMPGQNGQDFTAVALGERFPRVLRSIYSLSSATPARRLNFSRLAAV